MLFVSGSEKESRENQAKNTRNPGPSPSTQGKHCEARGENRQPQKNPKIVEGTLSGACQVKTGHNVIGSNSAAAQGSR